MMEKLPQTEQASAQEAIVPLGLEEQEVEKTVNEFHSKYGVDPNVFQKLLNDRLQLFSDEANGEGGDKFKKDTENGMLKFLEQKHTLESTTKKQEKLQQESQEVRQEIIEEDDQYNKVRSDLGLPPDKTKSTVQLGALSGEAEDIAKQTVENQKQLLVAKEGIIGGDNLFNLTNDQIEYLDKNDVGFNPEDKDLLELERSLRADHTEAIKSPASEKEFNSSQWVDDFSGFSENSNLTEAEAEEALMVMKERFEELQKDEVFDRSEEIKNYENSIRNSELGKKYPDLVSEYVKDFEVQANTEQVENVVVSEQSSGQRKTDATVLEMKSAEGPQIKSEQRRDGLAETIVAPGIPEGQVVDEELAEDKEELEEDLDVEPEEEEFVDTQEKSPTEIPTAQHLDEKEKINHKPLVGALEKREVQYKELGNENTEFSEETQEQFSAFFMESLRNEKKLVEQHVELIRGIVGDSSVEANKNLMIFSRVVQRLSSDPRMPEKERNFLKAHGSDLTPIDATELESGINSYDFALNSVMQILDNLLTKEASVALHAYVEKISLSAVEDYVKHVREQESNAEKKKQSTEIKTGEHLDDADKIKIRPKTAKREASVNLENDFEKTKFLKKVGSSITEEIVPRMSRFSRSLEERSNERLAELLDDTDTGRLSKVFRNIGESFDVRLLNNKEAQDQLLRDIKNATGFFSQIDVLRPRTVKEDVESLIQLHRSLDQVANDINDLSRKVSNASLEQEGSNPGFLADLAKSLKNLSVSVEESPLSYEIRRRVRSLSR